MDEMGQVWMAWMGRDGMSWDDGMGWDGMAWHGMAWHGTSCDGWDGTGLDGMDGTGWMCWDGWMGQDRVDQISWNVPGWVGVGRWCCPHIWGAVGGQGTAGQGRALTPHQ